MDTIQCECGHTFDVPPAEHPQRARCSHCGRTILLPEESSDPDTNLESTSATSAESAGRLSRILNGLRARWKLLSIVLACVVIAGTVLQLCSGPPDPRYQFTSEFCANVDALVAKMRDARGTATETATVFSGGRMGETEQEVPRMARLSKPARELSKQFDGVSLAVLVAVGEHGFEDWANDLRKRIVTQRDRLATEIARLERDIRANSDRYPNSLFGSHSLLGSMGGEIYGWTESGELYVITGNEGLVLSRLLSFDEEAWISKVEEVAGDFR